MCGYRRELPEGYKIQHNPKTWQYRFVSPDGSFGIWHFSRDIVTNMAIKHQKSIGGVA